MQQDDKAAYGLNARIPISRNWIFRRDQYLRVNDIVAATE